MAQLGITTQQIHTAEETNTPSGLYQKQLDTHTKQLEQMTTVVLLGFALLLVMVATIVMSGFWNYQNSVDNLNNSVKQLQKDQYQFQQEEINFILSTSSAKLK